MGEDQDPVPGVGGGVVGFGAAKGCLEVEGAVHVRY